VSSRRIVLRAVVVTAVAGSLLIAPALAGLQARPGAPGVAFDSSAPVAPPVDHAAGGVVTPAEEPGSTGRMAAAVAQAERAAGRAEPAVAIFDRRSGELAVGVRGAEPVYAASLAKLVVAVDILDRRRFDGLAVASSDIALLRRALGPSDDQAMNALWTRFDGPGAPARVSLRIGLVATTGPRHAGQWGEVSVSAVDLVRLWRYLLEDLPADDRDLLVSAMEAAPSRAADGFDQAFGLLAPEVRGPDGHAAVAKQGWMCCFSGRYYLHSAGAVGDDRRYLVALLTRSSRGSGWDAARSAVTSAAVTALRELG